MYFENNYSSLRFSGNPMESAEQAMAIRSLEFQRLNEEEIIGKVEQHWDDYSVLFTWQPQLKVLLFSATMSTKIPRQLYPRLYELISTVNEKLLIGNFVLCTENGYVLFRHGFQLNDSNDISRDQIGSLIDMAVAECERMYPAMQSVLWRGKSVSDAMDIAFFETKGEA